MASIKAKKGNPFERLVAYNLLMNGYKVTRVEDNSPGIDLIVEYLGLKYKIECKRHRGFVWNQLVKYFQKTKSSKYEAIPVLVFKGNNQPILTMYGVGKEYSVTTFKIFFELKEEYKSIPKKYKIWQQISK